MPSLERRHKHFVTDTSESADGQFRVDVILLWAVIEVIPALGTYLGHRGGTPASPRHAKLWHCEHPTSGCVPLPGRSAVAGSAIVEWVKERRDLDLGVAHADRVHLVRFRYDDVNGRPFMRPEILGEAVLAAAGDTAATSSRAFSGPHGLLSGDRDRRRSPA